MRLLLAWIKDKIINNIVCGICFVLYILLISTVGLILIESYYDNIYCLLLGLNLIGYSLYTTYWLLRNDNEENTLLSYENIYYHSCIDDN